MFDSHCRPIGHSEALDGQSAADPKNSPEVASSYTCPHCSYVNWCTFDAGHSGSCHCDQGHYWSGNH